MTSRQRLRGVRASSRLPSRERPARPKSKSLIPWKYRDPNTSGLSFPIHTGSNEVPLELKD
jgi:hypothetical protein